MNYPDDTPPPCIVLLNGFPGVGKLTVARELAKSFPEPTHCVIVDNHSIIDQATQSTQKRTPEYYALRKEILRTFFSNKIKPYTTVLMTACFAGEPAHDVDQWKDYINLARETGFVFVHVTISCSLARNQERLTSAERIQQRMDAEAGRGGKMKCIDIGRLQELRASTTMLNPDAEEYAHILDGVTVFYGNVDTSTLSVPDTVLAVKSVLVDAKRYLLDKTEGAFFICDDNPSFDFAPALVRQPDITKLRIGSPTRSETTRLPGPYISYTYPYKVNWDLEDSVGALNVWRNSCLNSHFAELVVLEARDAESRGDVLDSEEGLGE